MLRMLEMQDAWPHCRRRVKRAMVVGGNGERDEARACRPWPKLASPGVVLPGHHHHHHVTTYYIADSMAAQA